MLSRFFGKAQARLEDGFWPKERILAALRSRYGAVEHLGDEHQFCLYGVTDGDIRFVVVLVCAVGAPDNIGEVGFIARFSDFEFTDAAVDSMNRNLHISVASHEGDGDLYLIGGVVAAGEFSESSFGLILEAWKRDLMIVLNVLSGGLTFASAFPAAGFSVVRDFARNAAPARGEDGAPARDLFASFAGGAHRHMAVCNGCGGRGKTGFIARQCEDCDGSGFVAARH
ncbi:MAG: hypothetical protein KDA46_05195 [Parvularculaceae bacterium]|nr:hypothetical protein [Parvularculaceae bacterium]